MGRIVEMNANQMQDKEALFAGEIAAIIGLKGVITGDTLCDLDHPVVLESIEVPEPVVFASLSASNDEEFKKVSLALSKMMLEDPSLSCRVDEQTGETIVGARGELHLEVMVSRLKNEHHLQAHLGRPQVAFKESIDVNSGLIDGVKKGAEHNI